MAQVAHAHALKKSVSPSPMNTALAQPAEVPPPIEVTPAETAAVEQEDPWGPLRQRLLRHARVVVHEAALAEDLVQETLMAIFENPQAHKGQAALTTWAIAILKNKVADWYRSPHQRRRVHVKDEETDGSDNDPAEALYNAQGGRIEPVPVWEQPENREAQRQMMTVMDSCLRRLPAQTSKVFMMREWLGFESDEIGERLGLSPDNTRTILHRARTGLRQCMSSQGHSGGNHA
ncbi:hypothetical protein LPB72_22850 [Hydrogenophaga crassostreae]|uniref:RNA polymerase subunit sigma n=2 Tax=Hydrogenophaga crassostreae TaxID=1763535 RepID=A0ABX2U066_9BURK|nr:hypothetical protein LPB72_22850 [Hydrogenophaga crassostreae]